MAIHTVILASCLLCLSAMQSVDNAQLRTIPDYMKICKTKDPEFEKCVTNSVMELRPYLVQGIPELDVPTIEPLLLKEIVVSDANRLRITGNNVKAFGCSSFIISNMKIDWDKVTLKFRLDIPLLYVTALYNVEGRIVLLPIKGTGPLTGNFTNCKGEVLFEGEIVTRDGDKYMNFKSLDIKINVGKGFVHLDNLFGGEKTIGDIVNQAINANFNSLVKQLTPSIEGALTAVFFEIANSVASKFTFDQLFPEE